MLQRTRALRLYCVTVKDRKAQVRKISKAAEPPPRDRRRVWIAIGLAVAVLAIYWQTLGYQFIGFDDDAYIQNNPSVRGGLTWAGIGWAFTTIRYFYWQPLTWLSHMLDCQVYGLNPGGHHFTSVLLHTADSVLLFLLLLRMTGRLYRSAFAAALFALHPLRVESVAWVAERKDVLSAFFWLLCLYLYVRYVERPSARRYLAVAAAFCAGLMSKPMTITLPVVLLLVDYWPLKRSEPLAARIREKLPLFFLSAMSGVITLAGTGENGALTSLDKLPLATRAGNAIVAYGRYLEMTFWPRNLAILYPLPAHPAVAGTLTALLILIAISWLAFSERRRQPWIVIGWCWFLVVLFPTIGIFQAGSQALADRFSYLPHIGLLVALVWSGAELLARTKHGRTAAAVQAAVILPLLAGTAWAQTRYWSDSVTLFEHALAVTSQNGPMEHNLGFALEQQGRHDEAIAHFSKAIAIDPRNFAAQYNLGKSLAEEGRLAEAIARFRESLRLKPDYAEAHYSLATAIYPRDPIEAEHEFEMALGENLSPEYVAVAHNDLGVILAQQGRYAEAETQFAEAVRLQPDMISAHVSYARALAAEGRSSEARAYLIRVLGANGENAELRQMLNALGSQ